MAGGGPQGTKLGLFLFLILINAAGYPHLEKWLGHKITGKLSKRTPLANTHMKYVDDLTLAQALNMKDCLIRNPDPSPTRPLAYHDRTNHLLPTEACKLQEELEHLTQYAQVNEMQINRGKTKVMLFNTGRLYDGMPKLTLPGMGEDYLEVVEQFKLLGVIIRSDMKWTDNTDYICQKGYQRLWMLRRLKGLGASEAEMLDVYQKQVRSVLELAVPVWQPALTQHETKQIERVQRCALYIILGEEYESYESALDTLESDNLNDRRTKLCQNFAKKSFKHPNYTNWFCESEEVLPNIKTRGDGTRKINKLKPVQTRTQRYSKSPLPYLTELLNKIMTK